MTTRVKQLVRTAVDDLKYSNQFPDYNTLDSEKISRISAAFESEFVTRNAVLSQIMDEAYRINNLDDDPQKNEFTLVEKNKITDNVYNFLYSIPKKYLFLFPLPFSRRSISYRFTDSVEVKTLTSSDVAEFNTENVPSTSRAGILSTLGQPQTTYKIGKSYLIIKGVGWVSNGGYTTHVQCNPKDDPLFMFKIIMASYLVHDQISKDAREPNTWHPNFPIQYSYNVHYAIDKKYHTSSQESSDDARLVREHGFINEDLNPTNVKLESLLKNVRRIQHRSRMVDNQRALKIALYWFYEANKSSQSHARLVHLTTAIDALLKSVDNKEFKAELVANLISTDTIHMSEIYQDVIALYAKRNEIIHGLTPINITYNPNDELGRIVDMGQYILKVLLKKKLNDFSKSFNRVNTPA